MAVAAVLRERLVAVATASGRHLELVDAAVASALTAGGLAEVAALSYSAPVWLGVGSSIACTALVAVRRRAPFTVAAAATVALAAYQISTQDPDGSFIAPAAVLIYYTVGRAAIERRGWRGLAAVLLFALAGDIAIAASSSPFSLGSAISAWPIALVPAAAGVIAARHASLVRRLADATAGLRAEQQVRADRLLGEERNRVARELHDVVAHHVSVMVIQAGAARLVAGSEPAAADDALRTVEQSGRHALVDLRRIMGAIRRTDPTDAAAAVGLAHVDQLVEHARVIGVPIEVSISGRLERVPAAVDLVAYRVVQEALTNVVKHARLATASLAIEVGHDSIGLTVTDTGGPSRPAAVPGTGHGLIGMRERVGLYGGQLTSGPTGAGGFRVRAIIPLRSRPLDRLASDPPSEADQGGSQAAGAVSRLLAAVRPRANLLLSAGWLVALEVDALTDHYRRGPLALNIVSVAVLGLCFGWRRRAPLAYLLVVGIVGILLSSGLTSPHSTLVGFFCVTVPTFTVAAWLPLPRAAAGIAFWCAGSVAVGLIEQKPAAGIAGGLVMSCLLWSAGRFARSQHLVAARLCEAQLLLAVERGDRERLAVVAEQARIARELHTGVAQCVVAMIVQAAAARAAVGHEPNTAAEASAAIESIGREALARMRSILGVLRAPHDALPVRPQPGVGELHALIERMRAGGRPVELRVVGDPLPLPAGVDLTTYRIIEAALAETDPRPSSAVTVVLRFAAEQIEIELTGDAVQLPARLRVSLRERAALCNGELLAPCRTGEESSIVVRLPCVIPEAVAV